MTNGGGLRPPPIVSSTSVIFVYLCPPSVSYGSKQKGIESLKPPGVSVSPF